ncbi:RING/FYVE/PHD zinc finger superfamily protein [Raphanus sativus]|uniref:Uncharacterized protein LOC108861626 n=1 Tax=Raphanus sativus TaxID=3726 RepID=A0A6J0P2Y0_RAPSA|nr:uncharacterized protein LOC108861626 [Raphanus sativus]XP_018491030.1 uncharacterized protein LOC108861626 [Raphanus sativus]XP_056842106.1 uncharacterized protein LOC108861626 [Raphanus sativus]KAJ4897334.1 RING/FYVE/PHD zinc finger superfamily protein [Raphanus sativus]
MGKENQLETANCGVDDHDSSPVKKDEPAAEEARYSTDSDSGLPTCRVCHSVESDRRGDTALGFLGITPPIPEARKSNADEVSKDAEAEQKSSVVKSNGEVFICTSDIEMGIQQHQDSLLELGCSCRNELALVHYACALKWFLNHGSTVCEICGNAAENIKTADFNKVVVALRERTADGGDANYVLPPVNTESTIDADEAGAIRRQRLSEISSWFGPHSLNNHNNNSSSVLASQATPEQALGAVSFGVLPTENRATKWAVEGTGILLATGLLTVTLVWLIAPRVGKKTARSGLHILLGGLCALTIVIFFRFVVLTRIKYGPARYWAILFIFWFLVFGIWASRSSHGDS